MNEFIEKNKKLLKVYCVMAQVIGWVLMLGGFIWFVLIMGGPSPVFTEAGSARGEVDIILYTASSLIFDFFFPGLIALGVTQFIRCLLESEYKPGFILRHNQAFLYSYAWFLLGYALFRNSFYNFVYGEIAFSGLLFAQPLLLPIAAKFLILIGLGQILKRILPVIEESKTLV